MQDEQTAMDRYLKDAGESLSTLAARIQRSPSTLTRALSGERNPSLILARDVERGTAGKVTAAEFIQICLAAGDAKVRSEEAAA